MELGSVTVRGNGLNLLQNGIHPRHGLVWTDGKGIFLAPVRLYGNDIENAKSIKLGEFDNVRNLHWSCDVDDDTCYLCAVHKQNVTVWKVTGSAPKLGFKQMRKVNVQPISQGCLWHPSTDVLCLLSRQQCSFYFRHPQKGSYAFPQLESDKITCGTWTKDGKRLVVCVGSIVLLYTWDDIGKSVTECVPAAWKVPKLDGSITSILSLSHDAVLCAAELPLESLCKQEDMFLVPEVNSQKLPAGTEGDVLVPNGTDGQTSLKDKLFNLQRNPQSLVQDSSQLLVLKLQDDLRDPTVTTSSSVTGVLSPDVLVHEPNTNSVMIGSNSQSVLQIYTFLGDQLHKVSDIQLEKNERPKGSSQLPAIFSQSSSGVLVVIGERDPADVAFPSTSTEAHFKLKIRYFPFKIDKTHLRNSYAAMPKTPSAEAVKQEHKVKSLSGSNLPTRAQSWSRDTRTVNTDIVPPPRSKHSRIKKNLQDSVTRHESLRTTNVTEETKDLEASRPSEVTQDSVLASHARQRITSDRITEENSSHDTHDTLYSGNMEILLPPSCQSTPRDEINPRKLVEDVGSAEVNNNLQVEKVQFSSQVPKFDNSQVQTFFRNGVVVDNVDGSNVPKEKEVVLNISSGTTVSHDDGCVLEDSLSDPGNSISISEVTNEGCEYLEKIVKEQKEQIAALQRKIDTLSQVVEDTSCVFPVKYQNSDKPEKVKIIYERPAGGQQSRSFLLDSGRLQLDPVKRAFGLVTVEMIIGDEPCVLGANIDGYIPMKFSSGSELHITGIPTCQSPSSESEEIPGKHSNMADSRC